MSGQYLVHEYEFELPIGYIDDEGRAHRRGVMRLAKVGDETSAREQTKESGDPELFHLAKLARVIIKLDGLDRINAEILKNLILFDYVFLKNFYEQINSKPKYSTLGA